MSTLPSNGNHGLVKRMRDLWTRIEPGTDDVVLMTQVSAILAEAAFRLERLEGEHENITRGRLPTHRCTVCDTFWMDLPEHKAMTMVGIMCGDVCCIGSNVEKLPAIRGSSETCEQGQVSRLLLTIRRQADEIRALRIGHGFTNPDVLDPPTQKACEHCGERHAAGPCKEAVIP